MPRPASICRRLAAHRGRTQFSSAAAEAPSAVALLQGHLASGRLAAANSLGIPVASAEVLNTWIKYWLDFGQAWRAESLVATHPALVDGKSIILFLRSALRKGHYEQVHVLKQQLHLRCWFDPPAFFEVLAEDICRKRLSDVSGLLKRAMPRIVYEHLLETLVSQQRTKDVNEATRLMHMQGMRMETSTYNRILIGSAKTVRPEEIEAIMEKMIDEGCVVNEETRYAVLLANLEQNNYAEAFLVLNQMIREKRALLPEHVVQIMGRAVEEEYDDLVQIVEELVEACRMRDRLPSEYYQLLVRHAIARRRGGQVKSIVEAMDRAGVCPDMAFVNELLEWNVRMLEFPRVTAILSLMSVHGLRHTEQTMKSLLGTFFLSLREQVGAYMLRGLLTDAMGTPLDRLPQAGDVYRRDFFWAPDRSGNLNFSRLRRLFEGYYQMPVPIGIDIFNQLLNSLYRAGRIEDCYAVLEEIRRQGLQPTVLTMTIVVKAAMFTGDVVRARSLVDDFQRLGLFPTQFHCAVIHHHYCRKGMTEEAEEWMQHLTTRYQMRLNVAFYGSLVFGYFKQHNYQGVFDVRERMLQAGLQPDTETCNYFMLCYLRAARHSDAVELFWSMPVRKNLHTFSIMMPAMAEMRQWDMFFRMEAESIVPGNDITAQAFIEPIRCAVVDRSKEHLVRMVELMVVHCVRVEEALVPLAEDILSDWLRLAVKHPDYRSPLLKLSYEGLARCLLEKTLIELDEGASEGAGCALNSMTSSLLSHYSATENAAAIASFSRFYNERLAVLRQVWTGLRPQYVERLRNIENFMQQNSNEWMFQVDEQLLGQVSPVVAPEGAPADGE